MRILKTIEERKITGEEGARLLAALGESADSTSGAFSTGRRLRTRVTGNATGRSKASVQIPLGLIEADLNIVAHFAPKVEGVDMSHIIDAVRSRTTGKIIHVTIDKRGEHGEVSVEYSGTTMALWRGTFLGRTEAR